MEPNLSVEIAKIKMKNPVMVASGTFGYGQEYEELVDLSRLGAIVPKSITLAPREGNPPPRVCETPSGMLNSIGLANVGLEAFVREKMPFLRRAQIPIIVSIAAENIKDYLRLAQSLSEVEGVSGLEVNISCPNVEKGGMEFGQDPTTTYKLMKRIRRCTGLTLIAKLTPNLITPHASMRGIPHPHGLGFLFHSRNQRSNSTGLTSHLSDGTQKVYHKQRQMSREKRLINIGSVAKAAEDGGADAIALINSVLGMAVDIDTRAPRLANVTGGLTGPAIKPIALRCLWEVKKFVDLPLIGMGGIMGWKDALEFIITGATAVACGTANFVDPGTVLKVIDGLTNYLRENEIEDINTLVGSLRGKS